MKSNHKVTLGLVLLNAGCAILWAILAYRDVANGNDLSDFIMHILCAFTWTLVSIANYIRLKKESK